MTQESSQKKAIQKLGMDVLRFRKDHNLQSRFAFLKLIIVVDFWPVFYYRLLEYCKERNTLIRKLFKFTLLPLKPIIEGFSGARIYIDSIIGGGLLLHQSSGVVIAPGTVVGENCTFYSGACLVYKANNKGFDAPKIGNNVSLMVGCKVIGSVVIGDNTSVGANAVVTKNVIADAIVVGVPGRIINR